MEDQFERGRTNLKSDKNQSFFYQKKKEFFFTSKKTTTKPANMNDALWKLQRGNEAKEQWNQSETGSLR